MAIIIKLVALAGFAIMFVWTLITGREQVPLTDRRRSLPYPRRKPPPWERRLSQRC
jgi:hypothetical protein